MQVYSAPSGKFRSHVDTPRGAMQFGSLVVSLPSQHEGVLESQRKLLQMNVDKVP